MRHDKVTLRGDNDIVTLNKEDKTKLERKYGKITTKVIGTGDDTVEVAVAPFHLKRWAWADEVDSLGSELVNGMATPIFSGDFQGIAGTVGTINIINDYSGYSGVTYEWRSDAGDTKISDSPSLDVTYRSDRTVNWIVIVYDVRGNNSDLGTFAVSATVVSNPSIANLNTTLPTTVARNIPIPIEITGVSGVGTVTLEYPQVTGLAFSKRTGVTIGSTIELIVTNSYQSNDGRLEIDIIATDALNGGVTNFQISSDVIDTIDGLVSTVNFVPPEPLVSGFTTTGVQWFVGGDTGIYRLVNITSENCIVVNGANGVNNGIDLTIVVSSSILPTDIVKINFNLEDSEGNVSSIRGEHVFEIVGFDFNVTHVETIVNPSTNVDIINAGIFPLSLPAGDIKPNGFEGDPRSTVYWDSGNRFGYFPIMITEDPNNPRKLALSNSFNFTSNVHNALDAGQEVVLTNLTNPSSFPRQINQALLLSVGEVPANQSNVEFEAYLPDGSGGWVLDSSATLPALFTYSIDSSSLDSLNVLKQFSTTPITLRGSISGLQIPDFASYTWRLNFDVPGSDFTPVNAVVDSTGFKTFGTSVSIELLDEIVGPVDKKLGITIAKNGIVDTSFLVDCKMEDLTDDNHLLLDNSDIVTSNGSFVVPVDFSNGGRVRLRGGVNANTVLTLNNGEQLIGPGVVSGIAPYVTEFVTLPTSVVNAANILSIPVGGFIEIVY